MAKKEYIYATGKRKSSIIEFIQLLQNILMKVVLIAMKNL